MSHLIPRVRPRVQEPSMPDQDLVDIDSQQLTDWERLAELIRCVHDARAAGELDARCDVESLHGAPRDAAALLNAMLERDTSMVRQAADLASAWAGGDFQATMQPLPGKASEVNDKLESLRRSLQEIASQMGALRRAALRGELSARAESGALQGEFLNLVQGMNETLDSIINPMNLASAYLESISQGEIPPKITESYAGDFEGVKRSINGCIDAVGGLLADTTSLAEAAVAGRLGMRADGNRHVGDFRRIIEGFNQTLDALLAPTQEAAMVLETLSRRNLSARVTGDFPGDHARIKNAVNQTAEALDVALRQVSDAVDQISSASSQIADGSQSVAQGASEQASALEQTSSSMEQMSGMTQQNADNTEQARVLADTTRQAADKGVRAMAQMVESIGKIRTSSEGTAVIIRDINDIAFQTNLLALNAAVEAARAGDAGRGFAVVAGEVRSLAQRAKEAANKTNELIGQSVRLTEEGQKVSQQVDAGLREIQDSALKVAGIVGEIAAASREQSKGIHQVNKALAEMDKITQQNAANSEQSSSAAEELASQAQALAAILGEFQLSQGSASETQDIEEPAARRLRRPTQHGSNGGAKAGRNGGRPILS